MILLDTNALVYTLLEPHKLGKKAKYRLSQSEPVCYSPLSIAEMETKQKREVEQIIFFGGELVKKIGLVEAPFTFSAASQMKRFRQLLKTDPYDWMLLSQSADLGANFYTTDLRLINLGLDFVVDAKL